MTAGLRRLHPLRRAKDPRPRPHGRARADEEGRGEREHQLGAGFHQHLCPDGADSGYAAGAEEVDET